MLKRFRPRLCLLLLLGAVTLLPSGGAAQDQPTNPLTAITENYLLAVGDRLRILVFSHEDISGEFDVDGTGRINYPLLGTIIAQGKTVEQLRSEIQVALDRDYIVDPKVSVEILNYRPIFVIGQVNAPGRYPYSVGMTVRQVVALAGGYTRRASTSDMLLIRIVDGVEQELEVQEDAVLLPGDMIEIERRFF